MDVDGVLTNGEIIVDHEGHETKVFDVQDGLGLVLLQRAGFKTAIISARATEAVTFRAKDLKIHKIYQDAYPKTAALQDLLTEFQLKKEEVCFIGDDVPDICVLKEVGFAVTVPNAVNEVKRVADYTTKKNGGRGAVRELVELILKTQGKWPQLLKTYKLI